RDAPHPHLRHEGGDRAVLLGRPRDRHARVRVDGRSGEIPAARGGDRMSTAAALLALAGALIVLVGSLGLVRLGTFYERVHPPTMGTTLGTGLILIGSMLHFSALESRPVLHEILIGAFMTLTTPVTYMLLVRAALYRERKDSGN